MKVLFALSLAVCIIGVYCGLEVEKHVIEDCITENKADKKIFDEAYKNKVLPAKSPEVMGVFSCLLKEVALMDNDGKFTKRYMEDEMTKLCRDITGKDVGEIAYNAMACLHEHYPKNKK